MCSSDLDPSVMSDWIRGIQERRSRTAFALVSSQSGPEAAATIILEEAHRFSEDLIVTGGYGHSRLREWILGGVTRHLINRSDIPLLMAH